MDQYDSQRRRDPHRHPQDGTPIYDRLLAEWRAARDDAVPDEPAPPAAGGLVPGARTSGESGRG
ncbi:MULTISPECIES: hypothetical protein [unclassified Streptomyces]|uniref:hypothetical protein n=1 Tax=unclassified Streptomyces TaxID=2593676 RepID=UPI00224D811B|nr:MULTISPECIES: hypothetical protein [unclassified Streptomyces]MCX5143734.1 hypothetical protein [Streptomyces sp. NBC_00338]WRZ68160.1 hypothetical protein OG408_31660 [Streptomyces sp. NBC_01257]